MRSPLTDKIMCTPIQPVTTVTEEHGCCMNNTKFDIIIISCLVMEKFPRFNCEIPYDAGYKVDNKMYINVNKVWNHKKDIKMTNEERKKYDSL